MRTANRIIHSAALLAAALSNGTAAEPMAQRFPTTRVYLQQTPGEQGVEGWWRGQWFKNAPRRRSFLVFDFGREDRKVPATAPIHNR